MQPALGRTFYSSRPGALLLVSAGTFLGIRAPARDRASSWPRLGTLQWMVGKFAGSHRNFAIRTVI